MTRQISAGDNKRMENNKPKFKFSVSVCDINKWGWPCEEVIVKASGIEEAKEIAKRITGCDNIPCVSQATHYPC